VDHILENNNIAGHANNHGHNWINTRCTPGLSDNYTKGDYTNDMGRHVTLSYNDNIDTDMVVELKPIDASASYILNEIYTLVDHIIDNSSCNSKKERKTKS
jgi:hypothetical protein